MEPKNKTIRKPPRKKKAAAQAPNPEATIAGLIERPTPEPKPTYEGMIAKLFRRRIGAAESESVSVSEPVIELGNSRIVRARGLAFQYAGLDYFILLGPDTGESVSAMVARSRDLAADAMSADHAEAVREMDRDADRRRKGQCPHGLMLGLCSSCTES